MSAEDGRERGRERERERGREREREVESEGKVEREREGDLRAVPQVDEEVRFKLLDQIRVHLTDDRATYRSLHRWRSLHDFSIVHTQTISLSLSLHSHTHTHTHTHTHAPTHTHTSSFFSSLSTVEPPNTFDRPNTCCM